MKAIELHGHDLDGLRVVERPTPVPEAGEILVRVNAASLNYRDYAVATGRYQTGLPRPFVPLSDAAGVVVATGAAAWRFREGERVTTHYTVDWLAGRFREAYHGSKLGGARDGVLQQFVSLPESAWVATPAQLDDVEASTLPIAALTAWNALQDLRLAPGSWLLTQGTGSVSLFALQFARLHGLRVIAATTRPAKAPVLERLGADRVLVIADRPQWGQEVYALADGVGVDGAVDVGGNATLAQTLAALAGDGGVAVVGFLGGFGSPPDLTLPIITKRARLFGQSVGSRESFEAMNRAIGAHGLKPVVDRVFGFDDFRDAYALMGSGEAVGKIVIRL